MPAFPSISVPRPLLHACPTLLYAHRISSSNLMSLPFLFRFYLYTVLSGIRGVGDLSSAQSVHWVDSGPIWSFRRDCMVMIKVLPTCVGWFRGLALHIELEMRRLYDLSIWVNSLFEKCI